MKFIPRATDIITVTRLGVTFKASRRTVAHIDYTYDAFRRVFPMRFLLIIQPCYSRGIAASKGSHDYDAVIDFGYIGSLTSMGEEVDWRRLEHFLRVHGWAAFYRDWPGDKHVHAISLPPWVKGVGYVFRTVVGYLVDGGRSLTGRVTGGSQINDYVTGLDGLAGHNADTDWRPNPQPIFNYRAWVLKNGIPRNNSVK